MAVVWAALSICSFAQSDLPVGVGEMVKSILRGGGTSSGYPLGYTKSDFLPEFCDYTWDGTTKDQPTIEGYFWKFGEGFMAMHHYCRGLYRSHEARNDAKSRQQKSERYRRAAIEYDFVLKNTDDRFPLRAEVLVQKGNALIGRGDSLEAAREFQAAIQVRPDYIPAYVALSNYFRRNGNETEARRVLEAGVEAIPQSALLKTKLDALTSSTR